MGAPRVALDTQFLARARGRNTFPPNAMASTEELIEAVRHHRVLYDTCHPDYLKMACKDEIWREISALYNLKMVTVLPYDKHH